MAMLQSRRSTLASGVSFFHFRHPANIHSNTWLGQEQRAEIGHGRAKAQRGEMTKAQAPMTNESR
jgi:hypothetical protein